ncbi:unnamed protein product, partial [Phaeothamnion confervicola]
MLGRHTVAAINHASSALATRIQVAAVLEDLLDDLEVWEWANRVANLEAELCRAKRELAAVKASESALLLASAASAAKASLDSERAKELRDSFVRELWHLTKNFRTWEVERSELEAVQEQAERVPQLERDLQAAQRQLTRAQSKSPADSGVAAAADSAPAMLGTAPALPRDRMASGVVGAGGRPASHPALGDAADAAAAGVAVAAAAAALGGEAIHGRRPTASQRSPSRDSRGKASAVGAPKPHSPRMTAELVAPAPIRLAGAAAPSAVVEGAAASAAALAAASRPGAPAAVGVPV